MLFSAGYLFSLQLFFSLHALQHETGYGAHCNGDFTATSQEPSCHFCELFFDQTFELTLTDQKPCNYFGSHLFFIEIQSFNVFYGL